MLRYVECTLRLIVTPHLCARRQDRQLHYRALGAVVQGGGRRKGNEFLKQYHTPTHFSQNPPTPLLQLVNHFPHQSQQITFMQAHATAPYANVPLFAVLHHSGKAGFWRDAQHVAGKLVGRYGLNVIIFTMPGSVLDNPVPCIV